MTNPVLLVRTAKMYGDPDELPPWRSCWLWCPGCDHAVSLPVAGEDGTLPRSGPHWEWDGNVELPTFGPSILQHEAGRMPRCHAYVEAGRWRFLDDCGHRLAGQIVDMVPLPDWLVQDPERS